MRWLRKISLGACVAGIAWTAGTYPPFSWQAQAAVFAVGLTGCGLAFSGRPHAVARRPAPRSLDLRGASYWLIVAFAFFEWEVASAVDTADRWRPTLSEILDPVLDAHGARAVGYALWLLAGWELIKR